MTIEIIILILYLIFLSFFSDEGITIDVLQMLKPHHIPVLLRNYKFGIQVRFEHYLDIWRRDINKPLLSHTSSHIHYCSNNQEKKEVHLVPIKKTVSTQFSSHDLVHLPNNPSLSHSLSSSPSPTFVDALPPPKLTPAPATVATAKKPNVVDSTKSKSAEITPSTSQRNNGLKNPTFHNYNPAESHRLPFVSASHISASVILQSHPKGIQLLRYYEEHQTLTNAHRLMLVNLIATFFDDHNYHLSLQTSYNMERDILELFPTEQLENYRTEKRGKIYVKFCNMKRYKITREKTPKRKKRITSIDFGSSLETAAPSAVDVMANMVDDEFSMNFDSWSAEPTHPLEVYVKTENLNDENYT